MDEVMDFEIYYDRKKDGSYVIHFPHNKRYSKFTLKGMFSIYGKVLSVDIPGKNGGLCFIRYEDLEAVKHCINGFKNHQYIKILPHKNKLKMNNTERKSQDYRQNESDDQFDTPTLKLLSSTKRYTSNENIRDSEDFSDTSFSSSTKTTNNDICFTNKTSSLKHLRRGRLNKSLLSSELCKNLPMKHKQLSDMDEIPALISVAQSTSPPMVTMAEEVIVANIDCNLSIHYILHLFRKYNPIAVSLMMTIPKSGIKYCHVYYKTFEDASATVDEFDKCLIRGKNLIVLMSHELMHEAL